MENNSLSNKSKAIALFKWTNRKYLSVSIAYWILLFLAYPLAEIFIMITSIPVDGQHNEYVDRMQTYGVLIPSTLFATIAIGYSIVISLIAFSYMHNKRCVDLFGSFPVSRRTLFFSRFASVIFSTLIPVIVIGLIGMILSFAHKAFIDGASTIGLLCLVLIGNICFIAIISLCCGTTIDVIICYGAINVCYPIAVFLCSYYPGEILPGVGQKDLPSSLYTLLCPIMAFFTSAFGDGLALHTIWWIGFIIVVTIVCYHLCKKRKAETAQNGFAFAIVEIIIKFLTCFTCGLAIGFIMSQLGNIYSSVLASYIWLVVGIIIGIFTSNILLHLAFHRGLSMFKSSLVESLVVFATTGIFIVIIATGGLGYDTTIPKESEVESVIVKEADREYFIINGKDIVNSYQGDAKRIKKTLELHKEIINKCKAKKHHGFYALTRQSDDDYGSVSDEDEYENTISSTGIIIKYKLKSGKIITRQYRRGEVPVSQDENVKDLVANDLTMITKIPVKYLSSCYIQDMQNGGYSSTDKDLNKKLIAALIKDLNNVKKIKKDEYDYSIDLNYTDSGENYNYRNGTEISVNIYSEYKNTLKVLNDSGVLAKLEE